MSKVNKTHVKRMSVLESVQCLSSQAMDRLDNVNLTELPAHAALEQVRATYCLCTVLARIHEELEFINTSLPMAGKGY